MGNQEFYTETAKLEGLRIIHPFYAEDERGFFLKSFEQNIFKKMGMQNQISEDFETFSYKNVIRGLHFQIKNPQIKMVRAIAGDILDVVVDLRRESDTFGMWESVILSDKIHNIFYIPEGFAHGFKVLSDYAIVSYKCVGSYDKDTDSGLLWNDTDIGIDWGDTELPIISERDKNLMTFQEFKDKYKGL